MHASIAEKVARETRSLLIGVATDFMLGVQTQKSGEALGTSPLRN